jgi:hypothetical protein
MAELDFSDEGISGSGGLGGLVGDSGTNLEVLAGRWYHRDLG